MPEDGLELTPCQN